MELEQGDKMGVGCAEGRLEAAAIFADVITGVPFGETKVEDAVAVVLADAAGTGAEAVD
jgi:hypothetical protein